MVPKAAAALIGGIVGGVIGGIVLIATVVALMFYRRHRAKTVMTANSTVIVQQPGAFQSGFAGGAPLQNNLVPHPQSMPPPMFAPQSTWRAASDGEDNWFVHTVTGEVSWVLPAGGVVVA